MDIEKLKKIMYVEDDPDLQQIVRLGLETGGGYDIKVCDSGRQAIREIKEFQPDLLILDVLMPELSGTQTLDVIRKIPGFEERPAIFLTSKTQPHLLEEYRRLRAIGVIRKPLNPLKLSGQVKEIWEKS